MKNRLTMGILGVFAFLVLVVLGGRSQEQHEATNPGSRIGAIGDAHGGSGAPRIRRAAEVQASGSRAIKTDWVPAESRTVDSLLFWNPEITTNSLWAALGEDLSIVPFNTPGFGVEEAGLRVSSAWYEYLIPWDGLDSVYCASTNDPRNPSVVGIKTTGDEYIILSDLSFGASTEELVISAETAIAASKGAPPPTATLDVCP